MNRKLTLTWASALLALPALALAQAPEAPATTQAARLPDLARGDLALMLLVLACALVALGYGAYLARRTLALDPGPQGMREVSAAIQEGAQAYMMKQLRTLVWFVVAVAVGLFLLYRGIAGAGLAAGIGFAVLLGACASYSAGLIGMNVAVRANARVASAAMSSYKQALEIAFRAGAVSGLFTTGLGLLGCSLILLGFREEALKVLLGFGFSASLTALFMRVGGGIYTKAADVGADLVGKVEAGIPEDDPRNAAVIADNVGDNVGDCAGVAADVFESYTATLVASIILGVAAAASPAGRVLGVKLVIYPLLVHAIGVLASIAGSWFVRGSDDEALDPMEPINRGFRASALFASVGFAAVAWLYLGDLRMFLATFLGVVLVLVTGWLTEYFTSVRKPPVTEIASATRTGAATMLLTGLAEGMESSVWAMVAIALTIVGAFALFRDPVMAFYAISLSGLGLLTITAFILSMDTFGPITDNANGILEMSGALRDEGVSASAGRMVARLDAAGNTTKALTKGFAIGAAVLAATSLFGSFIEDAGLKTIGIQINLPLVFVGLLIGGAVPFLFSSLAIRAVSRAAGMLVEEVRRQFREIPGLMEGKARPDYGRCVLISTAAAQRELLGPGVLAIATPILVTFGLGFAGAQVGTAALGGLLAGAILTGQLMAVFQANVGGAWDNAKKKIEDGFLGGKGTDYHKAAVVGDTVGDPLKDTAGPALNILIKVMNLVAILAAPVVIAPISAGVRGLVVAVSLLALTAAVAFSKRKQEASPTPAAQPTETSGP